MDGTLRSVIQKGGTPLPRSLALHGSTNSIDISSFPHRIAITLLTSDITVKLQRYERTELTVWQRGNSNRLASRNELSTYILPSNMSNPSSQPHDCFRPDEFGGVTPDVEDPLTRRFPNFEFIEVCQVTKHKNVELSLLYILPSYTLPS